MDTYKYGGSKNTGSIGWLLQRVSAIALVLLLLAHFVVIHYSGPSDQQLNFNVVRDRMLHPTWGPVWKTMTLLLLGMSLFHALNGTWGVLLDYIRKGWVRITLYSLIVMIGLVLATLGSVTVLTFRGPPPQAQAAEQEGGR